MEVAAATTVRPIKSGDKPSLRASSTAPRSSSSPPPSRSARPPATWRLEITMDSLSAPGFDVNASAPSEWSAFSDTQPFDKPADGPYDYGLLPLNAPTSNDFLNWMR
jgi:hypothetical protein